MKDTSRKMGRHKDEDETSPDEIPEEAPAEIKAEDEAPVETGAETKAEDEAPAETPAETKASEEVRTPETPDKEESPAEADK